MTLPPDRFPEGRTKCIDGNDHRWQPVSFRFETQLLDTEGRVRIRQPAIDDARVYFVCVPCRSWTYQEMQWIGWRMGSAAELERDGTEGRAGADVR